MKLFKRIVSITLWAVITLNVALAGITRMPAAQRYIGGKIANTLREMLGTSVSIGRVDFGLLNRIILDDLVILDQRQQEMLRAARVSVKMDILPLMEGKVSISSAQLFGSKMCLYRRHADAPMNYQFIIDSLASKDTTTHTPLNLRVNSLIIRHSNVIFDLYDKPATAGLFNLSHLKLSDISAHINLRALTEDSLNLNVKRLSFSDHSGLAVNRLNLRLEAGRQHALLRDFLLEMPSSQLKIDTLTADYTFNGKDLQPGSLSFSGEIKDTYVTPSDLR